MDGKYGRLFTAEDVVRLVNAMTHEVPDEELNLDALIEQAVREADGRPLTFPADEPLFLLRGKDKFADETVAHYALTCEWGGAGQAHVEASREAALAMNQWQHDQVRAAADAVRQAHDRMAQRGRLAPVKVPD